MEIFAAIAILLILLLFASAMRDFFSMVFNIPSLRKIRFRPADLDRFRSHLKEFPFFNSLNNQHKEQFLDRLITFMVNKEFIGKEGLVVSEKMKVHISATAVQLTLGLNHFILPHFSQIQIFKGEFGYPGKGLRMKGGTTESGKIYLSWKDFASGLAIPDDGYNLGLHEFAHALKIEMVNGSSYDENFERHFPHWRTDGIRVMQEMKNGSSTFLRKYGATNIHEYFAVSVERFFESSKEFKEKLPTAYSYLSGLLNQDPAENKITASRPIQFEVPIIVPQEPARLRRNDDSWHWSLSVLLSAIFLGPPIYIWLIASTDLAINQLVLLSFAAGVVNQIAWPYFREREILNRIAFLMYSFIGVGIWAPVLILALNFSIPVTSPDKELHRVTNCRSKVIQRDSFTTVTLENDAYSENRWLRTFYREGCPPENKIELTFRRGIFGIRMLHSYSMQP